MIAVKIRLNAEDGSRSYDSGLGRFTDGETIPCFRCGVCCQRWQPLVNGEEVERLARFLGMPGERFLATYTRPYPMQEDTYQLLERDGGCTFLRFEDGMAACSVHDARPQSCRDWDASLLRRECVDGIRAEARPAGVLIPLPLYVDPEDRQRFVARLRGSCTAG